MENDALLSEAELALSDEAAVALIEQRSNLRGDAAHEALTIIRGGVPADLVI